MAEAHQQRLANIQQFAWYPMLRLDFGILATFGWEQDVRRFIHNIGWDFLLREPPTRIHRTATMEFLASVNMMEMPSAVPGVPPTQAVSYWMDGAYRTTALDDFNVIMGFCQRADTRTPEYRSAYLEKPTVLTTTSMWREITGAINLPSNLKGAAFNPPLRICHKLLAGTIHSRKESQGKVTLADLFIVYCMHQGHRCNPGYAFLKAVKECGTRGPAGAIMVAPFLTPLAEYWGCTDGEDIPAELRPEPINGGVLTNMNILSREGAGFILNPIISISWDMRDFNTPQDIPTTSESQQQSRDQDFSGLYRRLDEEHAYMEGEFQSIRQQFSQLTVRQDRTDRQIESLVQTQARFQRRLLRRFPSPAPSAHSSPEADD